MLWLAIGGDYNQHVGDRKTKKFHEDTGTHNTYQIVNNIEFNQMCETHVHGSSPINAAHASSRILEHVNGYKMLTNNEIVESDHKGYLIDIPLDDYFEEEFREWDEV